MSFPSALPLRVALRRGAVVTASNWPVILVDFTIESLYKLALVVPVLGGAFMVASVMGVDVRELVVDGLRETASLVLNSLTSAPATLAAFLGAVGLVAYGGALITFLVKAATLAVLVEGERHAYAPEGPTVVHSEFRSARRFEAGRLVEHARRFGARSLGLATGLAAIYVAGAGLYLATLGIGFRLPDSTWAGAFPLLVLFVTSATFVGLSVLHLSHDLLRIIVITEDCSIADALPKLRAFLLNDARQVLGIFAVMTAVLILAGSIALLGAAALTLIAWVPFLGVLAVPLQLAAWLVRGLVFQALSLVAVAAYQAQYRQSIAGGLPADGRNAISV